MGCYEVSLGDTLGVGTPHQVRRLVTFLAENDIPMEKLAGHFHDTYGQALANVWEAYQCGIRVFDSSVAGLGGCPFAPGARGNVASEDVVYMFENAGIETGVNLARLVQAGDWISRQLNKPNGSRAGTALTNKERSKTPSEGHGIPSTKSLKWQLAKETDGLRISRSGVNLKLTMNRPKDGNCLTASMIDDLTSEFQRAATDSSISRVVVTGEGKFFCTGMDLSKNNTAVGSGDAARDIQFKRLTALLDAIDRCPKVTIACLNGPAFGGGVGLAFACDLRIAVRDAHITLSEVKLGICAATISKYIVREWGPAFSREAMLTARPVTPVELKQRGIIMAVADDAEGLGALIDKTLQSLRVASRAGTAMSKELVTLGWAEGGRGKQAAEIKRIFDVMMQPGTDGEFGVREFQQGRKVDWDNRVGKPAQSKL
ncbi:enoyl-CoA hydratase/isomerase domain-containing protein [Sarocladium implicatum]|nr:enoyl-CoA hydratase/isomerase domain-containing protein [Sarocladium implicatum]